MINFWNVPHRRSQRGRSRREEEGRERDEREDYTKQNYQGAEGTGNHNRPIDDCAGNEGKTTKKEDLAPMAIKICKSEQIEKFHFGPHNCLQKDKTTFSYSFE